MPNAAFSARVANDQDQDEESAEVKRQRAVMKIKQSIMAVKVDKMSLLTDEEGLMNRERRPSDSECLTRPKRPERYSPELYQERRMSTPDTARKANPPTVGRSASMRKPKPKPMIWEYFNPLPNTTQYGRCKKCQMNVSCKFNTGKFVQHLQVAHMDVYRQYQTRVGEQWTKSMLERNLGK